MRRGMRISCAVLAATVAIAACTQSADDATPAHAHAGAVDFPVSCNPAVQDDFNHAVTLLHHMTYMQARSAFRAIAERDPSCAMAQWGIAMTLFQPLWPTRPSKADLQRGSELVQKAEALKPPTAREQAFITAVGAFFRDPDSTDYWQRIQRWESAMASLHAAFPTDREGSAFYALALLASARPGPTLQEHSRQAVALLLPILRDDPNHPGAMHYIIHADDVPGREEDDIEIVRMYEKIAPDNPHALHMPTHIYTRLGDWDGVIRGNLRAADAALKFPAGENGELVWDEFPHAIEYLVYAYLQQGADDEAAKQIERLFATGKIEPTAKTAFHLASTRTRYALERQDFAAAAALVPREPAFIDWDRFPWPEAIAWFARGYGSVRTGDTAEAQRAVARLTELDQHATAAGEDVFARQIRILRLELDAWNAHAAHDDASRDRAHAGSRRARRQHAEAGRDAGRDAAGLRAARRSAASSSAVPPKRRSRTAPRCSVFRVASTARSVSHARSRKRATAPAPPLSIVICCRSPSTARARPSARRAISSRRIRPARTDVARQPGRNHRAASGGISSRLTSVDETSPPRITTAIGPSIS